MPYLKILRIPNLIIIAFLQSIFYFGLIVPLFDENNIPTLLSNFQFLIFIGITLLITGSGYIINDIFDVETDAINKRKNSIVGEEISIRSAKKYYYTLVILGFLDQYL